MQVLHTETKQHPFYVVNLTLSDTEIYNIILCNFTNESKGQVHKLV